MVTGSGCHVLSHPRLRLLLQQRVWEPMGELIQFMYNYILTVKGGNADHPYQAAQYLIFAGFISGVGTGCWYVAEAGAIMSLAPSGARGKYLALWIVSRNLGQLVGGAIKYVFTPFNLPPDRCRARLTVLLAQPSQKPRKGCGWWCHFRHVYCLHCDSMPGVSDNKYIPFMMLFC